MNTHTKHQIIEHGGKPLFVIVPYEEYVELTGEEHDDDDVLIPLEVSKIANLEDKSLVRAWREHLGLTQEEVATRAGISRPAYAQMEAKGAKTRRATLAKIAKAMGVEVDQLTE
jgi:DNA-binding XRE family transcriptional regulator